MAAKCSRCSSRYVIDGGAWQLVPRIGGAIKISPFSPPYPRHRGVKMDIHREITPDFPYTARELWSLCYYPSSDDVVRDVHDWGARAAEVWLESSEKGRSWCAATASKSWQSSPEELFGIRPPKITSA